MTTFIICIILLLCGCWYYYIGIPAERKSSIERQFNSLKDFTISHKIISEDGHVGMAIDEERKKICFLKFNNFIEDEHKDSSTNEPIDDVDGLIILDEEEVREILSAEEFKSGEDPLIINYSDIISFEVNEDGNVITKATTNVSRTSQMGNAAVGGLLFGGVGAVVGALTSSSSTVSRNHNEVNNVSLNIIINNTKSPVWTIRFLIMTVNRNNSIHRKAMEQATHWHGVLSVLMRQA